MVSLQEIEQKVQDIKKYLPDITDKQARDFANQVIRLGLVEQYQAKNTEDFLNIDECQKCLYLARKALDYTKPYRIAVIGTTGVGKSTFINTLVGGRDIVFTRPEGKATTGTVLEISFIQQDQEETATITYRDREKTTKLIRQVLEKLIKKNLFEQKAYPNLININEVDQKLIENLHSLTPIPGLTIPEQTLFEQYKKTIIRIAQQYNFHPDLPSETFKLNNPQEDLKLQEDLKRLNELTDEHSSLNQGRERKIDLIEKVTYKIKSSQQNGNLGLEFPSNVCLVDLPGLDGSLLHDIIILKNITEADAVIYINHPKKIDNNTDITLLSEVKSELINNSRDSYRKLFFVLTSKDNITITGKYDPNQLPQDMRNFIDTFLPGYTQQLSDRNDQGDPYFYVSSIAAYFAQKFLRKEQLETKEANDTYQKACLGLGINNYTDYQAVLNASQMPKLVEKLKHFVLNERIDQQINDGKFALDSIVKKLLDQYQKEQKTINESGNITTETQRQQQALNKRKKDIQLYLGEFLNEQYLSLPQYEKDVKQLASKICQTINNGLRKEIVNLWTTNIEGRIDPLTGGYKNVVLVEPFLSGVQIELWDQLADTIPIVAHQLVSEYKKSSQNLAKNIINGCYETEESKRIEQDLNDYISSMLSKLEEVASRISLVVLGKLEYDLCPNEQNQYHRDYINVVPQTNLENVQENEFELLIQTINKKYLGCKVEQHDFGYIENYLISPLIYVYRYEIIRINHKLSKIIEEIFGELSKRLYTDPLLQGKVDQEINLNPELQRLQIIQQKLADLQKISAIHS